MGSKIASYKYEGIKIPTLSGGSRWRSPAVITIVFLILPVGVFFGLGRINEPVAFFGAVAVLIIIINVFFPSRPGIVVSSKFLVFGDNTLLFANMQAILIDEAKMTCSIKSASGNSVLIVADKFPTDARKEWKIRNNKREKFYRVINKIIQCALKENSQIEIKVANADRLKHVASKVGS